MTVNNRNRLFRDTVNRWGIVLVVSIAFATGLILLYNNSRYQSNVQKKTQQPTSSATVKIAVTALGRLQPEGEVTTLSAPHSINGVRVEKLLVKEGDEVKKGQVMAYLEDYARAGTALQQAKDKYQVAQAKLQQIKSGAKTADISAQKATILRLEGQSKGEIATQQATISRIQAELNNAQTENNRYQQLFKEGAVAATVADSKRLQVETLQKQLQAAQATLNSTVSSYKNQIKEANARLVSLNEVRPVDVKLAEAEVKSAMTAVQQAKADNNMTYIKSPIDGKVLKIHTKTGEVIATSGFAEVGKISQMYVLAEVYQTDIQKVRVGQKATIQSPAFSGNIQGTVSEVGWQIGKQSILSLNPAADTDRRIVEVKIKIDDPKDSEKVSNLTNLQVDVSIHI